MGFVRIDHTNWLGWHSGWSQTFFFHRQDYVSISLQVFIYHKDIKILYCKSVSLRDKEYIPSAAGIGAAFIIWVAFPLSSVKRP